MILTKEMTGLFLISGLGLCQHCGVLLSIELIPQEAISCRWFCPKCKKEVDHESFGYDQKGERVKWVGADLKWTNLAPEEDFKLGGLSLVVRRPSPHLYGF